MKMRQVIKFVFLWMVFILGTWALSACNSTDIEPPEETPIVVWEYKNETAFDTVYPEGWEQSVLREGFLAFAPPKVALDSEPGPSMSVLRDPPGASYSSLQEEMDHILEFGPLREDYFLTSEVTPVEIGQYGGLEVNIEREATEMFIAMKGIITITRTDSGSLYTFIATAPSEEWEESYPLFLAILDNITFNE
jgi:hypothetical protein